MFKIIEIFNYQISTYQLLLVISLISGITLAIFRFSQKDIPKKYILDFSIIIIVAVYIGIKPSAWMAEAEESVDFDLLVVDWEKNPAGVKDLSAEFSKVTWTHTIGEIGEIDYTREKELIAELDVSTNSKGEASFAFTPPEPGTYQLDIFGGGARTEVTLWVGGPGTTTWPTHTNQKIRLMEDFSRMG